MTQFILKITLGNDAMQTITDITQSLKNVCTVLSGTDNIEDLELYGKIKIHDVNGNIVGYFEVK